MGLGECRIKFKRLDELFTKLYAFSQADLSVVRGEKGSEWQAQFFQKRGVARIAAQVL